MLQSIPLPSVDEFLTELAIKRTQVAESCGCDEYISGEVNLIVLQLDDVLLPALAFVGEQLNELTRVDQTLLASLLFTLQVKDVLHSLVKLVLHGLELFTDCLDFRLLLFDLFHCSLVLLRHPLNVGFDWLNNLQRLCVPVKRDAPPSKSSSCAVRLSDLLQVEGSLVCHNFLDFLDDLRVDVLLVVVFNTT